MDTAEADEKFSLVKKLVIYTYVYTDTCPCRMYLKLVSFHVNARPPIAFCKNSIRSHSVRSTNTTSSFCGFRCLIKIKKKEVWKMTNFLSLTLHFKHLLSNDLKCYAKSMTCRMLEFKNTAGT